MGNCGIKNPMFCDDFFNGFVMCLVHLNIFSFCRQGILLKTGNSTGVLPLLFNTCTERLISTMDYELPKMPRKSDTTPLTCNRHIVCEADLIQHMFFGGGASDNFYILIDSVRLHVISLVFRPSSSRALHLQAAWLWVKGSVSSKTFDFKLEPS